MISGTRILSIFRTKGGEGDSVKTANGLSEAHRMLVGRTIGREAEPLIVSCRSNENWFVITPTHVVARSGGFERGIDLTEVVDLECPKSAAELAEGKFFDGRIKLGLRDGSVFEIDSEPGKPYIGLVNVFMYVARVNRRSGG